MTRPHLPDGLRLARTTPEFDETSVPAGLLKAHQIAEGVWGRIVVRSGSLDFMFEDESGEHHLESGDHLAIPPQRPHHVILSGPATFVVEFYRAP